MHRINPLTLWDYPLKKIGVFLSAGFSIVLIMLAAVFVLALMHMGENQARTQRVVEERFVKSKLLNTMYAASRERSISLFSMVSLEDPFERDEEYMRFNAIGAQFAQARIALVAMALDDNEERLLSVQGKFTAEVVPVQDQIVDLMSQDHPKEATGLLLDRAVPGQNGVLAQLQKLLDHQQDSAQAAFNEATAIYEEAKRFLGALFILAFGLGVMIAVFVVRKTNASEKALVDANENLEQRVVARTQELSAANQNLRNSQRQLIQSEKMASLGQLTAGIAHEIKNPLNFINNFAQTSSQLVAELREELQGAKQQSETVDWQNVDELSVMLDSDMKTIQEHGKRIDSIIQSMLMHARGESGKRAPVDLNALVEQTLTLAYHGERAKNRGFNVRLDTQLAPDVGTVELVIQDISRMLVNLLGNAFDATRECQKAAPPLDYEPAVRVATRNLGNSVEIDIADNGVGIPLHLQDKLFSPFFTTKPTGEGTGLGLSISYDIVVDQHGGQIRVDSKEGKGTCFTIVLPRSFVENAEGKKELNGEQ